MEAHKTMLRGGLRLDSRRDAFLGFCLLVSVCLAQVSVVHATVIFSANATSSWDGKCSAPCNPCVPASKLLTVSASCVIVWLAGNYSSFPQIVLTYNAAYPVSMQFASGGVVGLNVSLSLQSLASQPLSLDVYSPSATVRIQGNIYSSQVDLSSVNGATSVSISNLTMTSSVLRVLQSPAISISNCAFYSTSATKSPVQLNTTGAIQVQQSNVSASAVAALSSPTSFSSPSSLSFSQCFFSSPRGLLSAFSTSSISFTSCTLDNLTSTSPTPTLDVTNLRTSTSPIHTS